LRLWVPGSRDADRVVGDAVRDVLEVGRQMSEYDRHAGSPLALMQLARSQLRAAVREGDWHKAAVGYVLSHLAAERLEADSGAVLDGLLGVLDATSQECRDVAEWAIKFRSESARRGPRPCRTALGNVGLQTAEGK
jgi:hypothetical protein